MMGILGNTQANREIWGGMASLHIKQATSYSANTESALRTPPVKEIEALKWDSKALFK